MIRADRQQAGIFALRAGVRLQRDRGIAGDRAQPVAQALDQFGVALRLVGWRERMDLGEARQRDRDHFRRCVELHRAGTERDHAAVQRDVLLLEPLEVAQHLVLGAVLVEHRLLEERRVACKLRRDRRRRTAQVTAQHGCEPHQFLAGHRLIERDADACVADPSQVEALRQRRPHQRIGACGLDHDGVEEHVVHQAMATPRRRIGQQSRLQVHPPRDALQPLRSVPHGVTAGDHRQQHLRGADVRRRLLAPDVLLARLQREPHRRLARRILRNADQSSRHVALVGIARGHIAGMRTAEAHRHAEALRRTHHHIGAHLARRRQQRERQRIGADDDQRVRFVRRTDFRREFADRARGAGILQHQSERLRRGDRCQIARCHIEDTDADRQRARRQHGTRLRMQVGRNRQHVGLRPADGVRHRHRLGRRGGLVQQRGVGDLHRRQFADHGLEVEQRLQPPLGDLRLIRRIGGVPARILQHIPLDHRRRVRAVIAHADQRLLQHILPGEAAQFGDHRRLVDRRRQIQRAVGADRRRHGLRRQIIQRRRAHFVQHRGDVGFRRTDVTRDKTIRRLERGELRQSVHQSSVSRYSS